MPNNVKTDANLLSIGNSGQFSSPDVNINHDMYLETTSTINHKRKQAPTKILNRKQNPKISNNNTLTSSSIIDNSADSDTDIAGVEQSIQPSTTWQYVVRSENKSYAICLLCDKWITTNNWSTQLLVVI